MEEGLGKWCCDQEDKRFGETTLLQRVMQGRLTCSRTPATQLHVQGAPPSAVPLFFEHVAVGGAARHGQLPAPGGGVAGAKTPRTRGRATSGPRASAGRTAAPRSRSSAERASLLPLVLASVADLLGAPAPEPSAPLMATGLDSLGVVELRNLLSARLGLGLPATLVFDHGTPAALAGYLDQQVAAMGGGAAEVGTEQDDGELESSWGDSDDEEPARIQHGMHSVPPMQVWARVRTCCCWRLGRLAPALRAHGLMEPPGQSSFPIRPNHGRSRSLFWAGAAVCPTRAVPGSAGAPSPSMPPHVRLVGCSVQGLACEALHRWSCFNPNCVWVPDTVYHTPTHSLHCSHAARSLGRGVVCVQPSGGAGSSIRSDAAQCGVV